MCGVCVYYSKNVNVSFEEENESGPMYLGESIKKVTVECKMYLNMSIIKFVSSIVV